jgi:hypothetical protein
VRRRFDEIVGFAGLGEVLDRPTRTYSTGMVARLSFSVAAHTDPDLFLIDEVLSVGDADFQRRCRNRIHELRQRGTTVVLVSHDLGLVDELCDRVVLLVEGAVDADGEAPVIIRRYLGLPAEQADDPTFTAALPRSSEPAGPPLSLRLSHRRLDARTLRVELVVREHPTFLGVGLQLSVVFGSATLDAPGPGDSTVGIATRGVPPGSYQVHCTLEDEAGAAIAARTIPVVLTGPEGPFAIRLAGSGDVRPAEAPTW